MADAKSAEIAAQGDKVRQLKAAKADKASVKEQVDILLKLKAEYKSLTGSDWKPNADPKAAPAAAAPKEQPKEVLYSGGGLSDKEMEALKDSAAKTLDIKIQNCGDVVRKLKTEKADKASIDKEVKVLLFLKGLYKEKAGEDWVPLEKRGGAQKENKQPKPQEKPKADG